VCVANSDTVHTASRVYSIISLQINMMLHRTDVGGQTEKVLRINQIGYLDKLSD